MSVLKSILHHWNSTDKAYDTLHPETEVGQITDFGKGLLNQLAATTAQSVISALQTNSWFGQLLKLVLNASGVKYSIDTNGYVCLGSFFGGLIIQWINNALENRDIVPPLTGYTKLAELATHRTGEGNYVPIAIVNRDGSSIKIVTNVKETSTSYWIGLFK